jgi:hypothetical protein
VRGIQRSPTPLAEDSDAKRRLFLWIDLMGKEVAPSDVRMTTGKLRGASRGGRRAERGHGAKRSSAATLDAPVSLECTMTLDGPSAVLGAPLAVESVSVGRWCRQGDPTVTLDKDLSPVQ